MEAKQLAKWWSAVISAPYRHGEQRLAAAILDACLADLLAGDTSQFLFLYCEDFDLWCHWLQLSPDAVRKAMLQLYANRKELLG